MKPRRLPFDFNQTQVQCLSDTSYHMLLLLFIRLMACLKNKQKKISDQVCQQRQDARGDLPSSPVIPKGSGWWLRQKQMKTQDIEVPHWRCRLVHYRIFEGHGIPLHMRLCEEILWCDRLHERQGFRQQRLTDPTVKANAVHYIWIRCCVWKVPPRPTLKTFERRQNCLYLHLAY